MSRFVISDCRNASTGSATREILQRRPRGVEHTPESHFDLGYPIRNRDQNHRHQQQRARDADVAQAPGEPIGSPSASRYASMRRMATAANTPPCPLASTWSVKNADRQAQIALLPARPDRREATPA